MQTPTNCLLYRAALVLTCVGVAACGGREAVRVDVPVVVDGERLSPFVTDLGYRVEITAARTAIADLEFTILGEEHQVRLMDWLVPTAHAHPGHDGNGEVTGELVGTYVVDWVGGEAAPLGVATMLTGDYNGSNFLFRSADESDGLDPDDPLLGHTMHIELTAERDGAVTAVDAVLDLDPGNPLIGAPFELELQEDQPALVELELAPVDPFEGGTAFDGIDFASLAQTDGAAVIRPGQAVHNQLRRAFAAHDHYFVDAHVASADSDDD